MKLLKMFLTVILLCCGLNQLILANCMPLEQQGQFFYCPQSDKIGGGNGQFVMALMCPAAGKNCPSSPSGLLKAGNNATCKYTDYTFDACVPDPQGRFSSYQWSSEFCSAENSAACLFQYNDAK